MNMAHSRLSELDKVFFLKRKSKSISGRCVPNAFRPLLRGVVEQIDGGMELQRLTVDEVMVNATRGTLSE